MAWKECDRVCERQEFVALASESEPSATGSVSPAGGRKGRKPVRLPDQRMAPCPRALIKRLRSSLATEPSLLAGLSRSYR